MGFQAKRADHFLRALAKINGQAHAKAKQQLQMGIVQILNRRGQIAARQML
jgi:hypothetical protein